MKRIALFMMLVALLAVHTGCRLSSTCCCHQTCCPNEAYDAIPFPELEDPAAETALGSISDSEDECFGGACRYDPVLPPIPEVDQEV